MIFCFRFLLFCRNIFVLFNSKLKQKIKPTKIKPLLFNTLSPQKEQKGKFAFEYLISHGLVEKFVDGGIRYAFGHTNVLLFTIL